MADFDQEIFTRDIAEEIENGKKCSLWGKSATDMSKDELIGFVGFLDDLATIRANVILRYKGVING